MTDPLIQIGGNADHKVVEMEMAPYMRGTRGKATISAAIAIAATVPVVVVFDKVLPTSDYSPQVTLEGDEGILASLSCIVKAGTRTTAGCTVSVKNSALVSLGINVIVHVTATY